MGFGWRFLDDKETGCVKSECRSVGKSGKNIKEKFETSVVVLCGISQNPRAICALLPPFTPHHTTKAHS